MAGYGQNCTPNVQNKETLQKYPSVMRVAFGCSHKVGGPATFVGTIMDGYLFIVLLGLQFFHYLGYLLSTQTQIDETRFGIAVNRCTSISHFCNSMQMDTCHYSLGLMLEQLDLCILGCLIIHGGLDLDGGRCSEHVLFVGPSAGAL